jgi:ABC-type iron transport system FetAB ATPase subunit
MRFCWREMRSHGEILPSGSVRQPDAVHIISSGRNQYEWLQSIYSAPTHLGMEAWRAWIETEDASFQFGSDEFMRRVYFMMRSRGLMANLTIRENLLLPFLYRSDSMVLGQAVEKLEEVADFLELSHQLDDQAGERSAYTHGLVNIGRCLLLEASIIIAQDIHTGMPPERLHKFKDLFLRMLKRLNPGLVYLSAALHEGSGIDFDRSIGWVAGVGDQDEG